ncbi:MAG TPA: SidA/IucD/PvdA family monooxygenase [Pseudonocardiaceae bacterium]|nr:SidA/IucD/PvdA family monooxygenase [Pseudonocardiaceae bacterium]
MNHHQQVELLAIGAGPANLALAIAMEELAPADLAERTLIVEQYDDVLWQRGMLLPWAQSQVSFLKDLVTLRNPCSRFSFLNYLHAQGRLDEFINLGTFTPYRLEISNYLQWVTRSLTEVKIQYGRKVVGVDPDIAADGTVYGWLVRFADGSTIACRDLVFGGGREAHVPDVFASVSKERLIHSTEYAYRVTGLEEDAPHRIVVLGSAQSAAEMLWASHQRFPKAQLTMVMRAIGLNAYETSKFTNELFYPSFVDEFYAALPEAREQLLREMHRTNYSGLAPGMLESLYRQMYLDKLQGTERLSMITMAEIVDARSDGDEVALTLLDRKSGNRSELRCDVVLLGTGFVKEMPMLTRNLAAAAGADTVTVDRRYRLQLPEHVEARVYLQGVNEATHGIADSLISVLAARSSEIAADIIAGHGARDTVTPAPRAVPQPL